MAKTPLPTTGLRRLPTQQRGEERVEKILRSAQAVFIRDGFENATTNAIAEEAAISIGSVYQFFPNKEAMLSAIGAHYREQLAVILQDTLTCTESRSLACVMNGFIDRLAAFFDKRPCFKQMFSASHVPGAISDQSCAMGMESASYVAKVVAAYYPELPADVLQRRAMMVIEMVRSLLPVSTSARGAERTKRLDEIKAMTVRYLEG